MGPRVQRLTLAACLSVASGGLAFAQPAVLGIAANAPPPVRDWPSELKMKVGGTYTVAAVGDVIIARPMAVSADPGLQAVIKLLRGADLTTGNFENNIRDNRRSNSPATSFVGPKEVANSVRDMGFDIMGHANNHAFDAGPEGMLETDALLEDVGVVTAGSGRDLDEAREAHFVETAKARVGLVAMHPPQFDGRFPNHLYATKREGSVGGRPGVNPLRLDKAIIVKPEEFDALKRVKDTVYQGSGPWNYATAITKDPADEITLFGTTYKRGDRQGINTWDMNKKDLAEILESIRNGKQKSHFMIAMIHAHQTESDLQRLGDTAPDFLIELARKTIDSGADMFVGTGPHTLRGIEIYHGKPIFYGLGELFHQLYEGRFPLSERGGKTEAEATVQRWDSMGSTTAPTTEGILAISKFENGELREVRLYPTDARYQTTIVDTGVPKLAEPAYARDILQRVQRLSQPFGTVIEIEGSVGVIKVGAATAPRTADRR